VKRIVYVLSLLLILGAANAYAHCGMCDMDKKGKAHGIKAAQSHDEKMGALRKKLGLSDEQAQQIEPLIKEKMEKKKALKEECHQKKKAIYDEYSNKIKALLNDEQVKKFDEWKSQWKSHKICPVGCDCPKCKSKKQKICPVGCNCPKCQQKHLKAEQEG